MKRLRDVALCFKEAWPFYLINFLLEAAAFIVYPYLILKLKEQFGTSQEFNVAIAISVLTSALAGHAFSAANRKLKSPHLIAAVGIIFGMAGLFFFSGALNFVTVSAGMFFFCLGFGGWLWSLYYVLTRTEEKKSTIYLSLHAAINASAVIVGSLLSDHFGTEDFSGGVVVALCGYFCAFLLTLACAKAFRISGVHSPEETRKEQALNLAAPLFGVSIIPVFVLVAFASVLSFSAINYLAPIFARREVSTFPVGQLFSANAFLLLVFQLPVSMLVQNFMPSLKWRICLEFGTSILSLWILIFFTGINATAAVFSFVILNTFAEMLLFPALAGASGVLSSVTSRATAWYMTGRTLGFGFGGFLWPWAGESKDLTHAAVIGMSLVFVFVSLFFLLVFKDRSATALNLQS